MNVRDIVHRPSSIVYRLSSRVHRLGFSTCPNLYLCILYLILSYLKVILRFPKQFLQQSKCGCIRLDIVKGVKSLIISHSGNKENDYLHNKITRLNTNSSFKIRLCIIRKINELRILHYQPLFGKISPRYSSRTQRRLLVDERRELDPRERP